MAVADRCSLNRAPGRCVCHRSAGWKQSQSRKGIGESMARVISLAAAALLSLAAAPSTIVAEERPSIDEIRTIAEQAAIYSLPMVMNYGTMYAYAVDRDGPQFKGPFNELVNESKVYTPADTAVILPNSDTPYSFVWMDLRAEPQVVCVPEIPTDRYYSVQLVSLYTYNFG